MRVKEEQLVRFLAESNVIPKKDLDASVKEAKTKNVSLGEVLLRHKRLGEDELRRVYAYILGIPFVNLTPEKIDFKVLSLIPEPIARNHNVIAYKSDGKNLEVAMLDVDDLHVLDFIRKKVQLQIVPRLTDEKSLRSALNQYKKSLKAEFDEIIQKESASFKAIADESGDQQASERDLKAMAEDLPIIKIVDTLISHAILQKASDIHIEPSEYQLLVRYRIDGILHDTMKLPKEVAPAIAARIKVLANLKLDEKRLPQDGRFKISNDTQRVSFRVSTLPTYYGEKTVIRILNETAYGFTLEGLGFHGEGLERIQRAMNQKTGIILISGPTGSGKTTTLYTILDILNTPEVNISTIEDPIEYQMARINQTQVRSEIGLTFAAGLRSLLRQDPDIIMVGEIRDKETASLAVNAALTGHLVLSTIHTNSAAGVVPRLIDMGIEPFLIASTLRTVIAQRLVRRLCANKDPYTMSEQEQDEFSNLVDTNRMLRFLRDEELVEAKTTWGEIQLFRPRQTADCKDGYGGRMGIHEIMEVGETIRDQIVGRADADQINEQAKKDGMMSMLEDGIYKSVSGVTAVEEVLRVVSS